MPTRNAPDTAHMPDSLYKLTCMSEDVSKLAAWFKLLSHPLRVTMVLAVADQDRCVHELMDITGVSQPLVSQHLRLLREGRVLKGERVGKEVRYSLCDRHVSHILAQAAEHLGGDVQPTVKEYHDERQQPR